jgi:hypothetical protein
MRVTLFSNSPPVYYTKTGRAYGAWIADGTAFDDIPVILIVQITIITQISS